MTFRTWASDAGFSPPARIIDREIHRLPPPCCSKRYVAADMLVYFGDMSPAQRQVVLQHMPNLRDIVPTRLYLCDGCRSTIERHGILARAEAPRSRPLPRS